MVGNFTLFENELVVTNVTDANRCFLRLQTKVNFNNYLHFKKFTVPPFVKKQTTM